MIYHWHNGRTHQINKTKATTITVIILLAFASACFGQDKGSPIAIDWNFNNADAVKLNLRGFSNSKVGPGKIAIWEYSRPMFDPRQFSTAYVLIGTGFGHVTKQTNRRELRAKLRKVAPDDGVNCIAYEI